ncbi:beta-ketoacyl synthase N-terminal-like domain-containing protein, partial [Streptomyces spongiae]|nr:hypothetical protein [Streptomyces spongiae]
MSNEYLCTETNDTGETASGSGRIAIVGLSCRLPGASDPDAFWSMLRKGSDALADVPAKRFGTGAGKYYGGFLDQVERFDPGFFGISPREAVMVDPQQRLMLELAWEALEDAGI